MFVRTLYKERGKQLTGQNMCVVHDPLRRKHYRRKEKPIFRMDGKFSALINLLRRCQGRHKRHDIVSTLIVAYLFGTPAYCYELL